MNFHAVIDTNVVVSALFKSDSVPSAIVNHALNGKIIPLLHEKILTEYKDVVNRPKFRFSQERIKRVLNGIIERGKFIDAKEYDEQVLDPKDKIFYWVTLTAREEVEAYLVTGNLKHFPIKPFIVTPREMLDILESKDDCDVIIRELKSNEYVELETFLYEAIYIPEGTSPPPRTIIKRSELQVYIEDFGAREADCCFVAEVDKKLVGACWARIMNDYGHIDDETPSLALSVLKKFRRRGIASALMKKLCAHLAEKNFKRVSLAVQKENLVAVKLYRKLNFEIVDERGEELLMIKRLGED